MRAREVIPFGKSVEEMEMKEREGGKRGKASIQREKFRGTFIPSYRQFVICILYFFEEEVASGYILSHMICLGLRGWHKLHPFVLNHAFILKLFVIRKYYICRSINQSPWS